MRSNLIIIKCKARTRKGGICNSLPVKGKKRCRMHGGAEGSGAPKGNQNAQKHGRYSAKSVANKRRVMSFFKDYRKLNDDIDSEEMTYDEIIAEIESINKKSK